MKKLLLSLGAMASVAAPVAAVVACGSTPAKTNPAKAHDAGAKNPPAQGGGVKPKDTAIEQSQVFKSTLMPESMNPFKGIDHDGLFMWDKAYDGELWNWDTKQSGDEVKGTQEILPYRPSYNGQPSKLTGVIEMGRQNEKADEDSVFMVYDNDDADGFSMSNFTKTFFFQDTSIAWDDNVEKINKNLFGNDNPGLISFAETEGNPNHGSIRNYIGGQNNHMSGDNPYVTKDDFTRYMNNFIKAVKGKTEEGAASVLKYYGWKLDKDGNAIIDPSVKNHADLGFAPVFYDTPIFTYEQVFSNVIKITFHDNKNYQATDAHFVLKSATDKVGKDLGELSLGKGDWDAYERQGDKYQYFARKVEKGTDGEMTAFFEGADDEFDMFVFPDAIQQAVNDIANNNYESIFNIIDPNFQIFDHDSDKAKTLIQPWIKAFGGEAKIGGPLMFVTVDWDSTTHTITATTFDGEVKTLKLIAKG